RLKWAVYGSFLGLVPMSIVMLVDLGKTATFNGVGATITWYRLLASALSLLVPVAFAYAVVKDRLFDVEVVVRRGVQYLLARNAVRALVLLPLLGIAVTLYFGWNRPLSRLVVENTGFLVVLAVAGLVLRHQREIATAVDRRFFREAYDSERVLGGLA